MATTATITCPLCGAATEAPIRANAVEALKRVRRNKDSNIYVSSKRAGERVLAVLRQKYVKLKLRINEEKSAVTRVWDRKFLRGWKEYSGWRIHTVSFAIWTSGSTTD